jgi:hypothetical protein
MINFGSKHYYTGGADENSDMINHRFGTGRSQTAVQSVAQDKNQMRTYPGILMTGSHRIEKKSKSRDESCSLFGIFLKTI